MQQRGVKLQRKSKSKRQAHVVVQLGELVGDEGRLLQLRVQQGRRLGRAVLLRVLHEVHHAAHLVDFCSQMPRLHQSAAQRRLRWRLEAQGASWAKLQAR